MIPIVPPDPVVVPDPEVVLEVDTPVLAPVLPPAPTGNSLPAVEPLHAATIAEANSRPHATPCIGSILLGM
jgi:hypothetical protein